MEFYNEKDLQYWKKQAQEGKAIILEIPVSMLLDLDIRSLSKEGGKRVSMEDIERWITENREDIDAALEKEREEKAMVEKMQQSLYDSQDVTAAEKPAQGILSPAPEKSSGPEELTEDQASKEVARIMSQVDFSDEQIAIIAEAMVEDLPDKYLLCFMKKEYTPAVMRKLKDYCMKSFMEEVKGQHGKSQK